MISPITQINLDSGRIFIYGEINEKTFHAFAQKLRYLIFIRKCNIIYIYIHSHGGDYESGCAIIDEIVGFQSLNIKICTIAIGVAESAAADILAMGTERYATPNTTIMMHPVQYNTESEKLTNIQRDTDFTRKQYRVYAEQIAKRCGYKTKIKIDEFIESIDKTLWLLPKEAKKMGIIDDIWDYKYEEIEKYATSNNE